MARVHTNRRWSEVYLAPHRFIASATSSRPSQCQAPPKAPSESRPRAIDSRPKSIRVDCRTVRMPETEIDQIPYRFDQKKARDLFAYQASVEGASTSQARPRTSAYTAGSSRCRRHCCRDPVISTILHASHDNLLSQPCKLENITSCSSARCLRLQVVGSV